MDERKQELRTLQARINLWMGVTIIALAGVIGYGFILTGTFYAVLAIFWACVGVFSAASAYLGRRSIIALEGVQPWQK